MKTVGTRTLKRAAALCCAAALALCVLLTLRSLSGNGLAGCSAGSACDEVLSSRWSLLFGTIPVSAPAAGLFLSMLVAFLFVDDDDERVRRASRFVLLAISGALLGCALWFTGIQMFVIGKFCRYCMSAHILGSLSAVLCILICSTDFRHTAGCIAAGLICVPLLAIFQSLPSRGTFYSQGRVEERGEGYELADLPLLGNENASRKMLLLYDYLCPHCRKLHRAAERFVERNPDSLAFVLCPVPLSPSCNHYIPAQQEDRFAGSCELAKLSLAVWLSDRQRYPQADSILWNTPDPSAALSRIESVTGLSDLDRIAAGDECFLLLSRSLDLFGRTAGGGDASLPRMVYGRRWITPEIADDDDLDNILDLLFSTD